MDIEQAQIEELKKKHGQIYEGVISFNDEEDKPREVEFVFREPKTADVEAYSKNAQTGGIITGNLNFIQTLVVYPEPASKEGVPARIRKLLRFRWMRIR